ncbi:MAG: MFS transporter, partial [Pseudomonadota bacterium]
YTVIESWLQAKTPNRIRGRVYGIFRMVDLGGQITAQAVVAVLDPLSFAAYNIVAMFCCLCLLPLALSTRAAPATTEAPRLRPAAAWRLSPTAMAAVLVAALSAAAFRMVGPVFALGYGLGAGGVALFLASGMLGGALAQLPVGWLADRFDRRRVLIGTSLLAVPACALLAHGIGAPDPTTDPPILMLCLGSALFGATAFPLHSVATTYANDFAPADFIVDLNASIIFFFTLGAIAAPLVAAETIAVAGLGAMFDLIAIAHLSLVGFALYRASRRPGAAPSAPYAYTPRTSMVLARLFRARPSEETDNGPTEDRRPRPAQHPDDAAPATGETADRQRSPK